MALKIGDRLGHYDVTALIGDGGMGEASLGVGGVSVSATARVTGHSRNTIAGVLNWGNARKLAVRIGCRCIKVPVKRGRWIADSSLEFAAG